MMVRPGTGANPPAYLLEVDGLRALAVVAVVVFHAFPAALPGGFVGVDIFFVISGYLITRLLRAQWETEGAIDIAAFYARRVRRILPLLVTVVLGTLVASVLLLEDDEAVRQVADSAMASLLFVANVYFQWMTGGYFHPATERLPLLHIWSLGVEEQFYLVWPLALGLLLAGGRTRTLRWVVALAALSALFAALVCLFDANAAFYLMPARFWQLAAGGLIALGFAGAARRGPSVAWAGLVLMLVAIGLPTHGMAAINIVLATLGAAALLWAVHGGAPLGVVGRALRSRPAVFVGLISYALYLWHWPLLALARAARPGPVPATVLLGLCAAALALAWLSHHLIEKPLRRPDPALPDRRLVAVSVLMCTSLVVCTWLVFGQVSGEAKPPQNLAAFSASDKPRDPRECRFTGLNSLDVFPKRACSRAHEDRPAVVIWGDSHAWALGPFAEAVARGDGLQLLSLTRDACPPALGFDVNRARPVENDKCRRFNELAAAQIRPGDTVIVVGNWLSYGNLGDMPAGVAATVAQAAGTARRVLLLGPSPVLADDVPHCIAARDAAACRIGRAAFDAQTRPFTAELQAIAARFGNVSYVSRAEFFCNASECPAMRDGYALYWDRHHPTSTAARAFAQAWLGGNAAAAP